MSIIIRATIGVVAFLTAQAGMADAVQDGIVRSDISTAIANNLDSRVRVFAYTPDVVYTLPVTVGMHTNIQMGEDEWIIDKPKLGESIRWRVTGNEKNLYIKALKEDATTSFTVVTDKRTYQFELVSTKKGEDRIQKASFIYPDEDERMQVAERIRVDRSAQMQKGDTAQKREQELSPIPINAKDLSFFRIDGPQEFQRMTIFDDGIATTVRMPPGMQDLPIFFIEDADKKLMPVNYTVIDRKKSDNRDVIRIERTSPIWVLRLGKTEIRAVRD